MANHWKIAAFSSFVLALCAPGSALAAPDGPALQLVGTVTQTGQALLWVVPDHAYVVARVGDRVQGYTVRRLLADRVLLSRRDELATLRLTRSPVGREASGATDRAPAGIRLGDSHGSTRGPIMVEPLAMTLPAPPISPEVQRAYRAPEPGKESAPTKAQAKPSVTAQIAAPSASKEKKAKTASVAAPAKEVRARVVSLRVVRGEVSRYLEGSATYRGVFTDSGLLELSGVSSKSLLHHLGLRNGDRIESVGGRRLSSTELAMDAYLDLYTLRHVEVVFWRQGDKQSLTFHLAS